MEAAGAPFITDVMQLQFAAKQGSPAQQRCEMVLKDWSSPLATFVQAAALLTRLARAGAITAVT